MAGKIFILQILLLAQCSLSRQRREPEDRPQLPVVDTDCGKEAECDPDSKYRPIDGSCLNPQHPNWGAANAPFARFLQPKYADGREQVRKSVKGCDLPKVRQLSIALFPDKPVPDKVHTTNVMAWGQVIAHDVTLRRARNTKDEHCCVNNQPLPVGQPQPDSCFAIENPPNDPFYSQFNVGCIDRPRVAYSEADCHKTGPIADINDVTHTIDGSFMYGNSKEKSLSLRSLKEGKLKSQRTADGKEYLVNRAAGGCPHSGSKEEDVLYDAGDGRVNQNTGITLYTTLVMRLHNQLCDQLKRLNPRWQDDQLFEEARRIVIAFLQHVTFKHYLPIVLGNEYVKKKGLIRHNYKQLHHNYFNPEANPSTFAEFSGAAFRSFHSMVTRKVEFKNPDFSDAGSIIVDDFFFRPAYIQQPGKIDQTLMGFAKQYPESQDNYVSVTLTQFLNKTFIGGGHYGFDLESVDLYRGRDLGLDSYNSMREACGLKRADRFEDFADVMTAKSFRKLKSLYGEVEDVDLFAGGMMETLLPGTLVGRTFQCIIGEQFWHYLHGDSRHYENLGQPWSFSPVQLASIYNTSLAWFYCQTGDNIHSIQLNPFFQPSESNPVTPCDQIPGLNIALWKE